jgi:hypothetical protein
MAPEDMDGLDGYFSSPVWPDMDIILAMDTRLARDLASRFDLDRRRYLVER